jgi:hypothetical protein
MRYFRCNVLGGFRLTDINKGVKADEIFSIDKYKADVSSSIKAALKSKWLIEISADEASKKIEVAKEDLTVIPDVVVPNEDEVKASQVVQDKVIGPDFKAVEERSKKKAEEARLEGSKEQVSVPDFSVVEKRMAERRNDTINKGRDEIIKNGNMAKRKKAADGEQPPVSISLAKEESILADLADNSQLSVPQMKEQVEERPIVTEVPKRRRRKVSETV